MNFNERDVRLFAASPERRDNVGLLKKMGEGNRSLQDRWFVLKGNLLFYFKSQQVRHYFLLQKKTWETEPFPFVGSIACGIHSTGAVCAEDGAEPGVLWSHGGMGHRTRVRLKE